MGTSGAYSGSGGKDGKAVRETIGDYLDSLSDGPGPDGERPPLDPAELRRVINLIRPRMPSGGGGDGPGSGGAAGGATGSRGGGGPQRSAAGSARTAGRAAAAAYAYSTGDAATLQRLGLDYNEIRVDGRSAGITEFRDRGNQRVFFHTQVAKAFQGKGMSSALLAQALEATRAEGMRIVPVCPAVAAYLKKHSEFADVADPVTPEVLTWLDKVLS